jgi:hypothetical protein
MENDVGENFRWRRLPHLLKHAIPGYVASVEIEIAHREKIRSRKDPPLVNVTSILLQNAGPRHRYERCVGTPDRPESTDIKYHRRKGTFSDIAADVLGRVRCHSYLSWPQGNVEDVT